MAIPLEFNKNYYISLDERPVTGGFECSATFIGRAEHATATGAHKMAALKALWGVLTRVKQIGCIDDAEGVISEFFGAAICEECGRDKAGDQEVTA